MHEKQQEKRNSKLRCLLLACVSICLILSVGVTYARYEQDFTPVDYGFTADGRDRLILGGVVTQSWLDAGSWPENPSWQAEETSALLSFSVSNGKSTTDFAAQDQVYVLELLAGLGIGAPENLTVQLSYEKEGQTVLLTGAAEEISAGSLLQGSFGDGWLYRFYDASGKEQQFWLSGGTLDYQNFTLTVTGVTDSSLLMLQAMKPYSK